MLRSSAARALPRQVWFKTASRPLFFSPHPEIARTPLLRRSIHVWQSFSLLSSTSQTQLPLAQTWRRLIGRRRLNLRWNSSKVSQTAVQEQVDHNSLSVYQKFKEISRKYGWTAFGVYWGLSAIDLPFCFLGVRYVGAERMGEIEESVKNGFWRLVSAVMPSMAPGQKAVIDGDPELEGGAALTTEEQRRENASIWTQLLFAYGVHKSLIIFRIPLTVAVTPKVVKTLRSWGWNVGPRIAAAKVVK